MSNFVPAGVAKSFSKMIWRRSILLLVYGVGARSDVTEGVWRAVEKGHRLGTDPKARGYPRKAPLLAKNARNGAPGPPTTGTTC
jgi:hypothetical protein